MCVCVYVCSVVGGECVGWGVVKGVVKQGVTVFLFWFLPSDLSAVNGNT